MRKKTDNIIEMQGLSGTKQNLSDVKTEIPVRDLVYFLALDGVKEKILKYLNAYDWFMLSSLSKESHTLIRMFAFDEFKIFLGKLLLASNLSNELRAAAETVLKAKNPDSIDDKFQKLLFAVLSSKKKYFYPITRVHHPERTIYHPGRWAMFRGDEIYVSEYTSTVPAYTETIQEPFTITPEILQSIYTPEISYLFESQGRIAGQFLGSKNREQLKRLYQLWQLLEFSNCAKSDDQNKVGKIKFMLAIDGHRLVYFALSSWFKDMANFLVDEKVCPLHISIEKQYQPLMTCLIDHGALLDKRHLERMQMHPPLLSHLFDHCMNASLDAKNKGKKWHPLTIRSIASLNNVMQEIDHALTRKKDWEQFILLTALLDVSQQTLLSQLIPRQWVITKIIFTSANTHAFDALKVRRTNLFILMYKRKMAILTAKNDLGNSPIKRIFSASSRVTLFKQIFSYAGMGMPEDETLLSAGKQTRH